MGYEFTDDVSGLELDKQLVKQARELEIIFLEDIFLYGRPFQASVICNSLKFKGEFISI